MAIRDLAAAIAVFAVGAFFFLQAGNYPAGAAMFPRSISVIMMVCAVVLIVRVVLRRAAPLTDILNIGEGEVVRMTPAGVRRVTAVVVFTLIYVVAIPHIGFFTASAIFITLTAFGLGLRRPGLILVTTGLFLGGIYLLFERLFYTPLPPEILSASFRVGRDA